MPHSYSYRHTIIIFSTHCFPTATTITQKRLNITFRIFHLYVAEVVKLATLVNRPSVTIGHTLRNRQTPMELYVVITS